MDWNLIWSFIAAVSGVIAAIAGVACWRQGNMNNKEELIVSVVSNYISIVNAESDQKEAHVLFEIKNNGSRPVVAEGLYFSQQFIESEPSRGVLTGGCLPRRLDRGEFVRIDHWYATGSPIYDYIEFLVRDSLQRQWRLSEEDLKIVNETYRELLKK